MPPKLFYIPEGVRQKTLAHPINRARWFGSHQPLLLQMLRTNYGRDLLEVEQSIPPIDQISHRHIRCLIDERLTKSGLSKTYRSEFRVGEKYANVIRYRWWEFLEYAHYLGELEYRRQRVLATALGIPLIAGGSVTTVYPDPDPETSTVDGHVSFEGSTSTSWATARSESSGLANTTENPSFGTGALNRMKSGIQPLIARAFTLFDTSSIPNSDAISAAIYSLYVTAIRDNHTNGTKSTGLVQTTPASDTNLVGGDYAQTGSIEGAARLVIGSMATSAYNAWTLSRTGQAFIDKAGITKLGAKGSWDLDNLSPTPDSNFGSSPSVNTAEETGTSKDPKLVVTHAAVTFIPRAVIY